ncbi:MAG: hypothetical protein CMH22_06165 [Methylophaga sp.]|nr:hypothetical protein [Methylophaga sp.]|tara:strand:+ start:45571 stop:46056 length:486 start_codon:yes stop_codon:yes gene_type:complete
MNIKLTEIRSDLTDEATQRLENAYKEAERLRELDIKDEPRDEQGRTAQWYEDMGIDPSNYLETKENIPESVEVKFGEEDYYSYNVDILINSTEYFTMTQEEDFTEIEFLNGKIIMVEESIEEIEDLLNPKKEEGISKELKVGLVILGFLLIFSFFLGFLVG